MTELLLAGDIGGTKTTLRVIDPIVPHRPLAEGRLATWDFASLEDLLLAFVTPTGLGIGSICLGLPGPVVDGFTDPVNTPWCARESDIARRLGARRCLFINDLVATAWGIPTLTKDDLRSIRPGQPRAHAPIAIVAPGTGLGQAMLVWTGTTYEPVASEGGHAGFAPRGERQRRLHAWLEQRSAPVFVEQVVSGRGIANIWEFLSVAEPDLRDNAEVEAEVRAAKDRTAAICRHAAERPEAAQRCAAAVQEFTDALAAESAGAALRCLAYGGVYLAGGVPAKQLRLLTAPRFSEQFLASSTMAGMLAELPVQVVLNPDTATQGAVACGLHRMQRNG